MKIKQPTSVLKQMISTKNKMQLEVKEVTVAGNLKIKKAFIKK